MKQLILTLSEWNALCGMIEIIDKAIEGEDVDVAHAKVSTTNGGSVEFGRNKDEEEEVKITFNQEKPDED